MTEESTNGWLTFLSGQGARFSGSDPNELESFDGAPAAGRDMLAALTDVGLIAASGDDAAAFLHAQLTNDVAGLGQDAARLAGYCTPKGRLLATMLMWRAGETVMLQLPRQLQPAIQKRLQMYVLRAKAKLEDAGERHAVLGRAGPGAAAALAPWFPDAGALAVPYAKADSAAGALIRLADADGAPRYQWVTDPQTAIEAWPRLAASLRPAGLPAWRLLDIHAGIPRITSATQEQFVPQMINYEAIGGVNFRKGCYPGQEIVARSQYLGKQKRRMMPATVLADRVEPGMEVFSSADPGQPCGLVVNAEPSGQGRFDCLVETKTAALDSGSVHLGAPGGPALEFGALPYPLAEPA